VYIAKAPTERRQGKTAISFAAIKNNESAEAKNSKDTVMSGVGRGPGAFPSEKKKSLRTEGQVQEGWRKDVPREWREEAQREKTGPRVQRDEQSARCG